MLKKIKSNFWIILILFLALFIRTYKLADYPEAVDEDEMSMGYISYSLMTSGTDEYGNKFPIYFKSVDDYKYGLYSYLSIPAISLFGLNDFSVRLTSAVFGALSVLIIYLVIVELLANKTAANLTAFVLALNPLHIHFSRVAYSNITGAFLTMLSVLFLIKFLKSYKIKLLIPMIITFVMAIYTYQSYRLILPLSLLLISVIYLFGKTKSIKDFVLNKKRIGIVLFVNLFLILITLFSFISKESRARTQDIGTLSNLPKLIESFSEDNIAGSKLITTRIFHNKYLETSKGVIGRYLSYFDPKFLFLETDSSATRHGTPDMGVLFLIELPLFLIGLYFIFKSSQTNLLIPLILMFTAAIPASLVLDGRSTTRSIFLVYGLSMVVGLGIYQLLKIINYKIVFPVLIFLYLISFTYFYHQYTVHKVYHHPWNSDVGLSEMVDLVLNKHFDNYEKVVVSKGHYISFLFYTQTPAKNFIDKTGIFEKLIFHMPYDCPAIGQEDVLYVCFGYKVPKAGRVIEVIRYRDGLPAILLVDFNEKQSGSLPERVEWGEDVPFYKLDEKDYWPNNSR